MQNNRLSLIVDRSENGSYIKESAYDMALARKTAELVRKHGIHFDRQVVVPADDDLADRLYEAGLELFLEMGVYNQSTERRIQFTRPEVEAAVASAPRAITHGLGKTLLRDAPPRGGDCRPVWSTAVQPAPFQRTLSSPDPVQLRPGTARRCFGWGLGIHLKELMIIPGSAPNPGVRKQAMVARQAINIAGRQDSASMITVPLLRR
jgi:hypothetical protein